MLDCFFFFDKRYALQVSTNKLFQHMKTYCLFLFCSSNPSKFSSATFLFKICNYKGWVQSNILTLASSRGNIKYGGVLPFTCPENFRCAIACDLEKCFLSMFKTRNHLFYEKSPNSFCAEKRVKSPWICLTITWWSHGKRFQFRKASHAQENYKNTANFIVA